MLFISPAAELGGAERCLLDFIAALRGSRADTVNISVLSMAEGPLLTRARALGVDVEVIVPPTVLTEFGESGGAQSLRTLVKQVSSAPSLLRFLLALRRAIVSRQPHVVHSNGMKAHLLAGLLTPTRSRLIIHLHDFVGSRRASRRLLPALARLRPSSIFAANSRAVAEDFCRLAPLTDVRTLYNKVDVDYFGPGAMEEEWLAASAGLPAAPAGTVSFGLVATYARWKGHALFIEAAGRLQASCPGVSLRFYVVGGPIYATPGSQVDAAELRLAAERAGISWCFGLVPFQDDIVRVFRSLNVIVHASIQPEPFGRIIVEAMACARPVIVSNGGGAAELFEHGETAWGFAPGDAAALAEAMAALLDAPLRARLAKNARSHALAQFSRARLAPELLHLYDH